MRTKLFSISAGAFMMAHCLDNAWAATITVTSTNDAGAGSLRQAIADANATTNADTVAFAIPGVGPHVIALSAALPDVTQPLTIDGFTQAGASANTLPDGDNAVIQIRLDGAGAFGANGLRLRAADCQVRGLSIVRFAGQGVVIIGGTNCVVAGNFIGLAPDGTAQANRDNGVQIFDSPGNRIGGTAPADRNVLSGNFSAGVHLLGIGASNNVVEGNFIGPSPDGSGVRGNFVNGVFVQDAPRNRIGGVTAGARNVISGNTPDGVRISGGESVGNVVLGNFVGPSASGTAGLGSQNGVNLESGATNRLGGSAAGEANVISGNSGFGVGIGFSSSGNLVFGNRIGVGPTGGALQNGAQGVVIRGNANQMGGTAPGEGNEIANNAPGIEVEAGAGNVIRGNSIHDNRPRFAGFGGLGIDLAPFGITANDAGDADSGVNLLQNFPVLTAASGDAGSTRVQGTLNSRPSVAFALDFFSNPDCDPSGNGEGLKYLGAANVTTGGDGNISFDVNLPVAAEGRQITATATDANGNTSEFSPCFAISVAQPPRTYFVTNDNDSGPGSLRQALLDAQASPASANNTVAFNIGAGGSTITIRPTTPFASIFEGVTIDGFTQPGSSANTLPDGNNAAWRIRLDGSLLGAGANGLPLNAPGCVVRGLEVAGFPGAGIHFANEGDSGFVEGCHLLDNQTDGLCVDNASGVTIGGLAPASRNVIHRNGVGILISGATATGNIVAGNFIGPDAAGAGGSGNFGEGVLITALANGNLIGGTATGSGNRIAFNGRTGVTIFSGANNDILGNNIAGNAGLGIELFPGANGNLAAPTITAATILANGVQCSGTIAAQPNTSYTLQTFSSLTPNAGGEFFLGAGTAATDGSGNANFTIATAGNFTGQYLTVTLTGPNEGTSKFSSAFTPTSVRLPGTFTVRTTANDGPDSLRQVFIDADNFLAAGNNVIAFDIPGTGVKVIQPQTPLPQPRAPITIDGFTQPGSQPNTQTDEGYDGVYHIQLDGALQGGGAALSLSASGCVVRGLSITRFGTGLALGGAGGHSVQGNLIGVDPSLQPAGNTGDGVEITSPNNHVGGTNPADRNVLGANGDSGIVVITTSASHNDFHGNLFGFLRKTAGSTNPFLNLGNGRHGIQFRFDASDNRVGGPILQHRNFFGFNAGSAVSVESGLRNNIFNNEYLVRTPFPSADKFIAVAPSANGNILPPTLEYAHSDNLGVRVGLRYTGQPSTTHAGEIYFGEKPAGAPFGFRQFKPSHRFNLTTDGSGNVSREELVAQVNERFARTFAMIGDPAGNSSGASGMATVVPAASADLQTQLFMPASATVGSNFTVTVVVSNTGPAIATNVTVRQILAPGVEVVAVSAPGTHTVSDGFVDYALGNLASGQVATITLAARGTKAVSYQFSARAQHQGVDPNFRNDVDQRTVQIVPPLEAPQADILGTVVTPSTVTAGEIVAYTFRVRNQGPDTATGVRAGLQFPRDGSVVESVEVPPGANYTLGADGDGVTVRLANLAPQEEVVIIVGARFAGYEGDKVTKKIRITTFADTADPNLDNNASQDFVNVETPLNIKYDRTDVRVNWPAPSPGVQLLSTPNLTPPVAWTPVPPNSIVTANGVNTHTVNPRGEGAPPQQFYRLGEKGPPEPQAEFNQLSLDLDGVQLSFTDWGQVVLTLPKTNVVRYANVAYNTNWVIQNVPILSGLNGGAVDRVRLNFPLGTNGALVFTARTGFTVTTNITLTAPPSTNLTFIGSTTHVLASGEQEFRVTYTPAQPLLGGRVLRSAQARPGFPNREQGTNECAPAAIVNSLEYLNAGFDLGMSETNISLEAIKEALGWTRDIGVPVGDDLQNAEWVQAKAQYMRDRNLGIITETTTNAAVALDAVAAGHDVEIRMTGHVACIVDVTELPFGLYALAISHDVEQGNNEGGRVVETVLLDPGTGKLTGTTWARQFIQFVIERPE